MKLSVCFLAIVLCTLFVAVLCTPLVAVADTRDTLSNFDPQTASIFYRDPGIQAQAARFDLPAPGCLRTVTLWLGGRSTGTVQVMVYGNEGAFPAPLLEHGLCEALTVRKTEPGVQQVQVAIPDGVCLDGPQFFVEVSGLSDGIVWLSDRREKQPRCTANGESWLYQAIKTSNGQWQMGKYSYAVEAVIDYPSPVPADYLTDVTAELFKASEEGNGEPPLLRAPSEARRRGVSDASNQLPSTSITWTDINNDSYIDLLFNGHLWVNRSGERFEESSDQLGGVLESAVHHAIDIENDGDPDILLLGLPEGKSTLLKNDGAGYFRRIELELPAILNPTSISFADADGDGYLDAYIIQGANDSGQVLSGYYLHNTGNGNFTAEAQHKQLAPTGASATSSVPLAGDAFNDVPSVPLSGGQPAFGRQGVQWTNHNTDNLPDLAITAHQLNASRVYINDGTGSHPLSWPSVPFTESPGTTNGTDWGDFDSDGDLDLLAPVNLRFAELTDNASTIPTLLETDELGLATNVVQTFPWEGFSGSGLWADVNNDGRLDALNLSDCNCRPASLYVQERGGSFARESFAWGLYGVPAGPDGVWIDYNNDGKLDLSTFVGDAFRLFKNTSEGEGDFIEVDLTGAPAAAMNGKVILYTSSGEQIRPIVSGRGALMQGPLRVHFGTGNAGVDSVAVEWNGGADRRVVESPDPNRLHRPFSGEENRGAGRATISISGSPNPFGTQLKLRYSIGEKGNVRITVHSVDGEEVAEVIDREEGAGEHVIEWRAHATDGTPLPAGTYIYRLHTTHGTATGTAVLVR